MSNLGMNIVVACDTLLQGKGGMERLAYELANNLALRGSRVTLVETSGGGNVQYPLESSIEIVSIPWDEDWLSLEKADRLIDGARIDAYIYFCTNHKLLFHVSIAERLGCRMIVSESASPRRIVYTNWRPRTGQSRIANATERFAALDRVDAIRVEVPESVNLFPHWLQRKVRFFTNGIAFNANVFPPRSGSGKTKKLLMVGGGKPHKRLDFFIDALPEILNKVGDAKILVAGMLPNKDLQQRAATVGVENHIEFLGPVEDMASVYTKADLHVICSEDESFGLSTVEAMYFGVPTVGCRAAIGTRNLVEHEKNGLLYPNNGERESFTECVVRALSDNELYVQMSRNCISEALKYSQDAYFENWSKFIREVCTTTYGGADSNGPGEYIQELRRFSNMIFDRPISSEESKANF